MVRGARAASCAHLGDVTLADPVEAELAEVEWPGFGPRSPHDDEIGDFCEQKSSQEGWHGGRGAMPSPPHGPRIIPPGRGRQQRRKEKQSLPVRSEQPCRAARSSRALGKDRSQPSSLKTPACSLMGNLRRRKHPAPGAWRGRQGR